MCVCPGLPQASAAHQLHGHCRWVGTQLGKELRLQAQQPLADIRQQRDHILHRERVGRCQHVVLVDGGTDQHRTNSSVDDGDAMI